MGLSIHYSGSIKDLSLVPQLTEEVKDICTSLNWSFHSFGDEDFQGICFSPPQCEPLFLTFNNSPEIASPVMWQLKIEPITTISVKTQFAGMDLHMAVIKLLKHLRDRYFSRFEMTDEGGYWESGDEDVLRKQFARYNFLLDAVTDAFRKLESVEGETAEGLAERLEKVLGAKWKDIHNDWKEDR